MTRRVRGRPDARRDDLRRGRIVDITGVSARARASPAPSSATTSGAAPRRTVPTLTASRARSVAARPRQGVQGDAAWPATWATTAITVKKATVVRTDAERNLLLVKGPRARARATRSILVQEGLSDAHHHALHQDRRRGRHRRPARDAVRGAGQRGGDAPGRRRRSWPRAAPARPTPRPAARSAAAAPSRTARRAPAAPARARAARRTTRAAAWSSVRIRARYEQRLPKRMKRLALHGALTVQVRRRRHQGRRRPRARRASRPSELVGYLDALKATGRVLVVATGKDEQARAVGAQPARRDRSSGPTRSTSSTS